MSSKNFSVTVSNVGTVADNVGLKEANRHFKESVELSKDSKGRFAGETVTLWRDGEPIKEYAPTFYFVEITDTYGGEANYSWCNRFKVRANSMRHALTKAKQEVFTGMPKHSLSDYGDMLRADFRGMAICAFVSFWDEYKENYLHVTEI
jgi:hypothetical protein